jgi:hypothetical protein
MGPRGACFLDAASIVNNGREVEGYRQYEAAICEPAIDRKARGAKKKVPPERGLSLRRNVERENRTCGIDRRP